MSGVQLTFGGLPLDPVELATVPILERTDLYRKLDLDPAQREAIEAAVRLVVAKRYAKRYGKAGHRAA